MREQAQAGSGAWVFARGAGEAPQAASAATSCQQLSNCSASRVVARA